MSIAALALSIAAGAFSTPSVKPIRLGKSFWLDGNVRVGAFMDDDDDDTFVVTPHLEAAFPLGLGHLVVGLDVGGVVVDGDDVWGLANPFLGYVGPISRHVRFVGGITLPYLDSDDRDDAGVAAAGLFNYNLHHAWTWMPDAASLVAGVDVVVPLGSIAALDSELRMAVMVDTDDSGGDEVLAVVDLEVGLRIEALRLGLGLVVFDDDVFGDSQVRATAAIGMRIPVNRGTFYGDFTVTLDDPALFEVGAVPSIVLGFASAL